jgi:hypothetical protein
MEKAKTTPDSKAPEQLLRFALISIKASAGQDAARGQLKEKKLVALLGTDVLQALSDGI